jgi:Uma2 family endonuclease
MEAQHMVQTPVKPLTLAAFLELPETEPASEYIAGQIIQKPMPQGKHRILQRDLVFALMVAFQPTRIAQWADPRTMTSWCLREAMDLWMKNALNWITCLFGSLQMHLNRKHW